MAQYPDNIPAFTTKVNNVDTVFSQHVNALQDEVTAIATKLGTNVSTVGSLVFIDNTGNLAALGSDLFWDSTNNRLGINNSSPTVTLTLNGDVRVNNTSGTEVFIVQSATSTFKLSGTTSQALFILNAASTQFAELQWFSDNVNKWSLLRFTTDNLGFFDQVRGQSILEFQTNGDIIFGGGPNVGFGDSTPSVKVDVAGSVRADAYIEYSDIYEGDALSDIKRIKPETGQTKSKKWKRVNHKSLPAGVKVPTKRRRYVKKSTGKEMTRHFRPGESKKILEKDYKIVEEDTFGRSVGAGVQLNTRAITQLLERVEILESGN